jgi:hypothetical protein
MRLSKHDLFQMDDEWLKKLPAELLLEVSKRLLHDVKALQDQLNKNPGNSSRPPSTKPPWEKARDPDVKKGAPGCRGRWRWCWRWCCRWRCRHGRRPGAGERNCPPGDRVPIARRGLGEAAGQASWQSGPWSHAETGGY